MAMKCRGLVNRRGGDVTLKHLPEIGIRSNTYFPMSDPNNLEITDLLSKFLKEKFWIDWHSRFLNESAGTSRKGRYAKLKPCFVIGIVRMRSPVAVKIALQTAGRIGGRAGSPKPVGGLLVFRKWTSICGGACDILNIG